VGLAADIGTLQRFPKIVGNDSKARELALTGRKFGSVEAKEIGFVSDVVQGGRKEVLGEFLHCINGTSRLTNDSKSFGDGSDDSRKEPSSGGQYEASDES
jgi:enoyl-CoA hydratase/carnithine racemase